jgi:hypothetical protein
MDRYSCGGCRRGVDHLAYIEGAQVNRAEKITVWQPLSGTNGRAAAIIAVIVPWHKACGFMDGDNISLNQRIKSMDNLIPQYEPKGEVFKNLMFCALSLTAGIFYFFFKVAGQGSFEWYDGLVLTVLGAGAGFFYKRAQVSERDAQEE